jgi:uncharacterized protein YcaQ
VPVSDRSAVRVTAAQAAAFRLARHHLTTDHPAGTKSTARAGGSLVSVVRDTGGIQAQVQSSAEMAIWTRRRQTTRGDVRKALWETRDLVKTSAMRLTLHLLPARDFALYIAAMRPSSMAMLGRWHARIGATPQHVRTLVDTIRESVSDQPRTQQELIALAKRRVGTGMRAWLDHAWSAVRPAVIDGAIVYGPPRGAEATFVSVERWLGAQPAWTVDDARDELLRRFLSAFGPASANDFAKWSGLSVRDARAAVERIRRDLIAVSIEGVSGWIGGADVDALRACELDRRAIRLLGPFDSFLLAHATKEHLVDAAFYKRVYRPQGWISAVVLRGEAIAGVWSQRAAGKTIAIDVELFRAGTATVRRAIEREVEALSRFLGTPSAATFR